MADNYKSIAKGNALFGGVQFYNICIGILRTKLVAMMLGPEGMGILGLLQSTIDLVKSSTNMGLNTSGVREMSIANSTNDVEKIKETKTILSIIVWCTGIFGTFVCFVFAGQLSKWSFGSADYTVELRILSIVLFIIQLTDGNNIVLQGLRQLKLLAKSNIIGNTLSMFIIIPLYYFFRKNGIVPAIMTVYITSFFVSTYYYRKLSIAKTDINILDAFRRGKHMLVLGFMLSLTTLLESFYSYVVKLYISNTSDVSEVGLYNAGFSMTLGYVGLVFSAICTDYFPRLSAVSKDKDRCNDVINDQMEIMVLVLLPLVSVFITCSPILIEILFTAEFIGIKSMINIIAVGMILRAISWCPGFMYMARGDSKLYLTIYVITTIICLILNISFYHFWGLLGIGVAFVISYLIGNPFTFLLTNRFYGYKIRRDTFKLTSIALLLSMAVLLFSFTSGFISLIGMITFSFISCMYSYIELDKRIEISKIIVAIYNRFRNN